MSEEKIEKTPETEVSQEEIDRARQEMKDGNVDIRLAMIDYCKRMNGYPYISASRIERIPPKEAKHGRSFLYQQLVMNYLMKTPDPNALDDFERRFCNGKLVFIQAHQQCPTMGIDGLYNSMDLNGHYIKSQLMGHFVITEKPKELCNDEKTEEGWSYFYKDSTNENFVDLALQKDVPLENFRKEKGDIYKQLTKPEFFPLIVVKMGKDKYGQILGDPFPKFKPEELAAVLKEGIKDQVAQQQ